MSLLQSLKCTFSRAKDRTLATAVTQEELVDVLSYSLSRHYGLAMGEIHGNYAFPDFMTRHMKTFKDKGVEIIFVEALMASQQHLFDIWQNHGNPQPLIDFMDAHGKAYSEGMWQRYFDMFSAAIDHGIRLVAIDDRVRDVYPGLELLGRNILWEKKIVETLEQGWSEQSKFLIYCGQAHVDPNEGRCATISDMLHIPGVLMENGAHGVTVLRKDESLMRVFIPRAVDQTPIFGLPMAPSRNIRFTPR